MADYSKLTNHIPRLEACCDFGGWFADWDHEGTREDPAPMPFVGHSAEVGAFVESFCEGDFGDRDYYGTLEKYGVELSSEGMSSFDVSHANAELIIALITTAIRADRFACEGILLEMMENGSMLRWLKRLREIDSIDVI